MTNITIIIIIILILTIVIAYLSIINNNNDVDITTIELLYIFPEVDSDLYLAQPRALEIYNGNIYITDRNKSLVHKFSVDGSLYSAIGGEGRGPGEFIAPTDLVIVNDTLFVLDRGNRRIQLLTDEGSYLHSFHHMEGILTFTKHRNTYYVFREHLPFHDITEIKLIGIIDSEGNFINEFGEYLNFIPGMIPFASWPIISVHENLIYVLFQHYPILRKYGLDGGLHHEIELSNNEYRDLIPNNYKRETFEDIQDIPLQTLFTSMFISDSGIFLALYNNDLVIDHYDFNGEFIKRYNYVSDHTLPGYITDFSMKEDYDTKYFYVLANYPHPCVKVFSTIN